MSHRHRHLNPDEIADLFAGGRNAHRCGLPRPTCPHAGAGWDDRAAGDVRYVTPPRREGYYHEPLPR